MPGTRALVQAPALLVILAASGACSLAYQSTWLRELRLLFGASTPATSAVLCMFMGGLGLGGLLLGRRAERARRPLRFYAAVELGVTLTAALSPLTLLAGRALYLALGGQSALGVLGATLVRLLLAALIVGLPAFLMGGTLPAAARAFRGDEGRRFIGALYGANTLGAVLGAFVPPFFLFEALGQRATLWAFCALNALLAAAALLLSRAPLDEEPPPTTEAPLTLDLRALDPLSLGAAFLTGFVFFFTELVWYRLGTPLLGGSTYTFALILSLALLGIGLGGAWYARVPRPPSWGRFAASCALASAALALPLLAGDDLARLAEVLRGLATNGFWGLVLGWSLVAAVLVLPLSLVSGYQFPLLLALARGGARGVAADVGAVYGANTAGAILGALAGGFGLLPLLGATAAWRAAALALLLLAAIAAVRATLVARALVAGAAALVLVVVAVGEGPGALWRHGAIGAGRSAPPETRDDDDRRRARVELRTTRARDGREAATAVVFGDGAGFSVGGKVDGNAALDAMTQVGSAILPALVHGAPRRAFVVGLGTGQTAGWLAEYPGVERVRVAELEPDIVDYARLVAATNFNVVEHPRVDVEIGDGRELLLTSGERYDLILSEPSNPYRAGIAGFYTRDFYEACRGRLAEGGIFAQWLQGYEVEPAAVVLVLATLREVFGELTLWHLEAGDLLLLARAEPAPLPSRAVVERALAHPTVSLAFRRPLGLPPTWDAYQSRLIARPAFVDGVAARVPGWRNTDDRAVLEYSFARSVGRERTSVIAAVLQGALAAEDAVPATPYRYRSYTHRGRPGPPLARDPELQMSNALRAADLNSARALARALEPHPDDESLLFRTAALLSRAPDDEGRALAAARRDRLAALDARVAVATLDLQRALDDEPASVPARAAALVDALRASPWGPLAAAGQALERLGYAWPGTDAEAHALARRLAEAPFAARSLEVERVLVGRALASRGAPDAVCVDLEAELEGQLPLERPAWAARERCFLAHAPARAAPVTDGLQDLDRRRPDGFENYLPAPQINPVTNPSE